jgi:hypothetical protein
MSHLYALLAEAAPAQLVLPNWAFPAIAAAVFITLAFVTWSWRDVANRHSDKTGGDSTAPDAGHGHH